MYYLSACNKGLFKSCYCYDLFLPFENLSNIMKLFLISSRYIIEKKPPCQQI